VSGTRTIGSLWHQLLKKTAHAAIQPFNNDFFTVASSL